MNNHEPLQRSNTPKKQKYSRLTAQIIKNSVKKQILDIKRRKSPAICELIDNFEKKLRKTVDTRSSDKTLDFPKAQYAETAQTPIEEIAATVAEGIALADKLRGRNFADEIDINDLLLKLLQTNRKSFESFLLSLASNCDAESLACFGTNLIYGGFVTETSKNAPRCRFIELLTTPTAETFSKLQQVIRNDTNEGRRVCVIHGNGLMSENMGRFCRSFSETAFILIDSAPSGQTIQGVYNAMYIPESANIHDQVARESSLLHGIASFSSNIDTKDTYSGSNFSNSNDNGFSNNKKPGNNNSGKAYSNLQLTSSNAVSSLFRFLSSPSLPIKSNTTEFYSVLCYLERIMSNGQNTAPLKIDI